MYLPIPAEQLKKKLIDDALITADEFTALETEARRKNQNILDVLIAEKSIQEEYLNNLVAQYLGVERARLDTRSVSDAVVKLLPEDLARQHQSIVFNKEADGTLDVAMLNPGDLDTVQFLNQYLKTRIKPFFATESDLNQGFAVYGLQSATDFRKIIEENIQASLRNKAKTEQEAAADLPIVAIVDSLLSYAIASRASDIHLEILEDSSMVRYRIDGIMHEIMKMPKSVHPALVARLKLLAGLKLDEHFKPQDGRFRFQSINQVVDVRVAVMPTYYGEKVEMRLLESGGKIFSLEELGMFPDVINVILRNLKKSYGMFLTTGPTGSGKSTTLYALINILNTPDVNIVTIEDPIEYNVRFINQSQINPQAGITFASGLRAFLRQDPNVIMVGEIRDAETANISVQAALTGHLLLSTLHTNDAATAIPRLFDMEVPPFLVGSVLNVVIAQRLVRRSCPLCIYSYPIEASTKQVIVDQLKALNAPVADADLPAIFYRSRGCSACGGSGYRGRIGIYEVLEVSDTIKKLIVDKNFDLDAVRKEARAAGLKTMFEDGLAKAQLGMTTIEEVLRVIRE